jgi:hypothetical protein
VVGKAIALWALFCVLGWSYRIVICGGIQGITMVELGGYSVGSLSIYTGYGDIVLVGWYVL